jgi:hypothetical protein
MNIGLRSEALISTAVSLALVRVGRCHSIRSQEISPQLPTGSVIEDSNKFGGDLSSIPDQVGD